VPTHIVGHRLVCGPPVHRAAHVRAPEGTPGPPTVVRVSLELRQSD